MTGRSPARPQSGALLALMTVIRPPSGRSRSLQPTEKKAMKTLARLQSRHRVAPHSPLSPAAQPDDDALGAMEHDPGAEEIFDEKSAVIEVDATLVADYAAFQPSLVVSSLASLAPMAERLGADY